MSLLASCSGDGEEQTQSTTTSSVAAATTTTTVPGPTIDWANVGTVELGDGYALRDEEGDAPIVAIYRGEDHIGIIEINRFPAETRDLSAHVESFHSAIESDRKDGCGSDYVYRREETASLTGPDGPLVRYGFTGAKRPGEKTTERTIQWASVLGDELVIINLAAYDEDGCIGTEGAELTTEDLEAVAPLIAPVIERSPFPRAGI